MNCTVTRDLGLAETNGQESKETGQVVIPPKLQGCPSRCPSQWILGLAPDKADGFETASYMLQAAHYRCHPDSEGDCNMQVL